MQKYANKTVFQYIIILIFMLITGSISLFMLHSFFANLNHDLDRKLVNVEKDIHKIERITYTIESIKSDIYSLSARAMDTQNRWGIEQNIKLKVDKIASSIDALKKNYEREKRDKVITLEESERDATILESTFVLFENLIRENELLINLLNLRDKFLQEKNQEIVGVAQEIRKHNAKVPKQIQEISSLFEEIRLLTQQRYEKIDEEHERKKAYFWKFEVSIFAILILLILLLVKNITSHITKLYEKIENRLYKDELTGLYSRYYFLKELQELQTPILILLDIDKFRGINELFGVEVGNEVLVKLSQMLKSYGKSIGFDVCRLSADEFVLYKEAKAPSDTKELETIVEAFNNLYKENKIFVNALSDRIDLEFTCGIAFGKENTLQRADMALDFAKQNNLPCKEYSEAIDKTRSLKHNIFWKKEIKNALIEDSFVPFFQPIVDRQHHVVKYESLARLKREEGTKSSFVPPFKFLDIALKTRYYTPFSKMVMMKTLDICKEKDADISINFGKKDIQNLEFHQELKQKIIQLGIGEKLIFEIVESDSLVNNKYLKNFIKEFKELGVKFAIDDFGSGFSNFSFILDMSPDFIKIDGTLIKDIDTNKHSYELVKSIVAFSHTLGIKLIAEYVHSKDVYDVAYSLGIDYFQGYYFDEPKEKIA